VQQSETDKLVIALCHQSDMLSRTDPALKIVRRLVREPARQTRGITTMIVMAQLSDRTPYDVAGGDRVGRGGSTTDTAHRLSA
jgi:hypothetical protein